MCDLQTQARNFIFNHQSLAAFSGEYRLNRDSVSNWLNHNVENVSVERSIRDRLYRLGIQNPEPPRSNVPTEQDFQDQIIAYKAAEIRKSNLDRELYNTKTITFIREFVGKSQQNFADLYFVDYEYNMIYVESLIQQNPENLFLLFLSEYTNDILLRLGNLPNVVKYYCPEQIVDRISVELRYFNSTSKISPGIRFIVFSRILPDLTEYKRPIMILKSPGSPRSFIDPNVKFSYKDLTEDVLQELLGIRNMEKDPSIPDQTINPQDIL